VARTDFGRIADEYEKLMCGCGDFTPKRERVMERLPGYRGVVRFTDPRKIFTEKAEQPRYFYVEAETEACGVLVKVITALDHRDNAAEQRIV
jgi:hypothetical protein